MIFHPLRLQKYRLLYLQLRAITSSTRFYILNIINNNDNLSVAKLTELTKMDQPIVSQQLAVLKKANLVKSIAQKKERYYKVNTEEIENLTNLGLKIQNADMAVKPDLKDSYGVCFETYKFLKFLLNSGRMILIEILSKKGELSISELARLSNQSQSIASQNAKILIDLKMVIKKEQGRKSILMIDEGKIDYLNRLIDSIE